MIKPGGLISFLVILAGLLAAYFFSNILIDYLDISLEEKDLGELTRLPPEARAEAHSLQLRMVDLGGVGIVPDSGSWGNDYAHHQRYFEQVMLSGPPYIHEAAFQGEKEKLAAYAGRMAELGHNAISLPWFLEFVNFDRVGNGREIYGPESEYRIRHDSLSSLFGDLMQVAADSGLSTYLLSDMLALTPPLRSYLEERFGTVDPENPELWDIYGQAAAEVFEKFPEVEGIMLRIGEAGSIYNMPGWDYYSELLVKSRKALRFMLEAFLEVAEKYEKTLIFRTWSVGIGGIGDMHTRVDTYEGVLGEIRSDHLVVSTKYCRGDFYSWLPVNPTLLQGSHRRMAEFQAKREFEGFGVIPNYLGPLHQRALQSILSQNDRLEGIWLWTQNGGPLRAGPLVIYPFYGYNVINELNVYAVSMLAQDPYVPIDSVTRTWIRDFFGCDSLSEAWLLEGLNLSNELVQKGLYISEFARHDVRALGLEPPPMLWIFEWDILGGSSSVFSHMYYISRSQFEEVLEEGLEAWKGAIYLKDLFLRAGEGVSRNREGYGQLLDMADYQIDLFRVLDYYRQFFMHYYRWIDTGDIRSAAQYKIAMGQFRATVDYHRVKYEDNLNVLGMDFEEALAGVRLAEQAPRTQRWARVMLLISLFMIVLGIPGFIRNRAHKRFACGLYFDALFRPYQLSDMQAWHSTGRVLFLVLLLYALGLLLFAAFVSWLVPLFLFVLGLLPPLMLTLLNGNRRRSQDAFLSLMAPKILIQTLMAGIIAVRGTSYFWYNFWTSDLFKSLFLFLFIVLIFRKIHIYIILSRAWSHRSYAGAAGMVGLALGIQVLAAALILHFFGLEQSLTALNNELLVLPGGLSKIMGITTHLDIPLDLPLWIMGFAGACLLFSLLLFFFRRRKLY